VRLNLSLRDRPCASAFGMLVGFRRAIFSFSHFEKNISDYKTYILFYTSFLILVCLSDYNALWPTLNNSKHVDWN
jgi:hypothetical protein